MAVLRRLSALVAVLLSTFVFPLTITAASLALPDIRDQLDAELAATQWVVNGYNVCFASFLVMAGALSDVFGKRRCYIAGLAMFCVTGIVAATVNDILALNLVRALGGVGAAAAVTAGASILSSTFHGKQRTRAFGAFGTVLGAGLAFGPMLGGQLVEAVGWRGVFAVPAIVGLFALAITPLLAADGPAQKRRVDWFGGGLFTVTMLLVIFVFVEAPELGLAHPLIIASSLVAVATTPMFVIVERGHRDPLVALDMLTNRGFLAYALAAGVMVSALVSMMVYLPSYLINVVGLTAGQAGLWLLMLSAPTLLLPQLGSSLTRWVPGGVFAAVSVLLTGVGMLLLTGISRDSTAGGLLPALLVTGCGVGLSMGVVDGLVLGTVSAERAGIAAGMINTSRLASETVAIAVVGAVFASLTGGTLDGPEFTSALRTVCFGLGVLCVLSVGVILWLARGVTRAEAASESVSVSLSASGLLPCASCQALCQLTRQR